MLRVSHPVTHPAPSFVHTDPLSRGLPCVAGVRAVRALHPHVIPTQPRPPDSHWLTRLVDKLDRWVGCPANTRSRHSRQGGERDLVLPGTVGPCSDSATRDLSPVRRGRRRGCVSFLPSPRISRSRQSARDPRPWSPPSHGSGVRAVPVRVIKSEPFTPSRRLVTARTVEVVKTRLTVAVLLTAALAACSQNSPTAVESPPAAVTLASTAQPLPTPTPAVSVAAVKLVRTPAVKRVVPRVVPPPRQKVWPVRTYRPPTAKPKHFICYIGKPCNPPPQYWTVTIGCTGAWRNALHRTTCPPGQPVLP
jgi:hypothetical protein